MKLPVEGHEFISNIAIYRLVHVLTKFGMDG